MQGFFEQCFAPLLARIFGYSGPSWISQAARSSKEADLKSLLMLLSRSGPLFAAINTADADGSTKFHFPRQRLPTHTQMLLASRAGTNHLSMWPQYEALKDNDQIADKGHLHVNIFQYFCYWFAFYAIKGAESGSASSFTRDSLHAGSGFGSSVRRAADVLHLKKTRESDSAMRYPYIALLNQLLTEFVPGPGANSGSTSSARGTLSPLKNSNSFKSAKTISSSYSSPFTTLGMERKAAVDANPVLQGMVFFSTLIEFWLKDADEPVPETKSSEAKKDRVSSFNTLWTSTYEPLSEDLLDAVGQVVKYATAVMKRDKRMLKPQPAQAASPWLPVCPVMATLKGGYPPVGPSKLFASSHVSAQLLGRQLFRMFYRAFTLWPDQRSIKPLLKVFLAYIAPWERGRWKSTESSLSSTAVKDSSLIKSDDGIHFGPAAGAIASNLTAQVTELASRVRSSRQGSDCEDHLNFSHKMHNYEPQWECHVLSNLPFYLQLIPLFLERSISRVSIRGESAAQDVLSVLSVLESSPELLNLLRNIEQDINKAAASKGRRVEGQYAEILPWLLEQEQDWRVMASTNASTESLGISSWGGRKNTVAVHVGSGRTASQKPYTMFEISEQGTAVTGRDLLELSSRVLKPEQMRRLKKCMDTVLPLQSLEEAHPVSLGDRTVLGAHGGDLVTHLPRSTWKDVKYKGDPMLQPISSFEIGIMVKVLVSLSQKLNSIFNLDQIEQRQVDIPPENRIEEVLRWLQKKGFRINLRPAADLRNIFWVPLVWLLLVWFFRLLHLIIVSVATGV